VFTTSHADLGPVTLHYGALGPADGPKVLFLHGWPDLWFTWEAQMTELARRGYRVIAPDQRGYGRSSKPGRVRDYRIERLCEDVTALIKQLELGPVHLVGHDWGGAVAYWLTMTRPELVRSLTVVNAPYPLVFAKALLLRPSQLLRSWYMFFFQIPGLADRLFELRDAAVLGWLLGNGARLDSAELARYREQWRSPGAVRAPLNWYRALFRNLWRADLSLLLRKIQVPTLILWGKRDPAFAKGTAERSARHSVNARVHTFDTGHWPFREEPQRFTQILVDWFEESGASDVSAQHPMPHWGAEGQRMS
jgi:pimeloyl-ACP methyl ester carboxylesterase